MYQAPKMVWTKVSALVLCESRANKIDHNKMFAWEKKMKKEDTNIKLNSSKGG